MRMAKRRNSCRAGFEKCPIPWKELKWYLNLFLDEPNNDDFAEFDMAGEDEVQDGMRFFTVTEMRTHFTNKILHDLPW